MFRQNSLAYRTLAFILLCIGLAACASKELPAAFGDLPPGDAGRGETLFAQAINGALACTECHTTDSVKRTGPGLGGYSSRAGNRVGGESAAEYTFYSIVTPSRYIVPSFSNVMYNEYAARLRPQQIADLIAFLLTL